MPVERPSLFLAIAVTLLLVGPSCGGSSGRISDAGDSTEKPRDAVVQDAEVQDAEGRLDANANMLLPPANGSLDYQLGGAYAPPQGVVVLSRDRNAATAPGLYNICYINGFQSQPDEHDFWTNQHPDLILRDSQGSPVIDPDWDEMLLDITTEAKRSALAIIVGQWIEGCADDGFDAIEIDNLDTYSRSQGLVSQANAVVYMRMLADISHARGLPIGQKNSTEVLGQQVAMGTDFAVAEECNRYDECGDYTDVYGDYVFVIEFRTKDFSKGCKNFPNLSIVLRDRQLVAPSQDTYVYDGC